MSPVMNPAMNVDVPPRAAKLKVATVSLAGCFGCHTSFLDIDERLLELIQHIEFDRSPLTDIKEVGQCDIGLIEGGVCNSENVLVLRAFRAHCKTLVAMGACAINGGLPAERNRFDYFLPGCPPSADAFWSFLNDLMAGRTPQLGHALMHYD